MSESHEDEFYFEFPVWIVVQVEAMRTRGLPYAMLMSKDENGQPVLPVFTDADLARRYADVIRGGPAMVHKMTTAEDLAALLRSHRDAGAETVSVDANVTADRGQRRIEIQRLITVLEQP
jgi:hypothetical protein